MLKNIMPGMGCVRFEKHLKEKGIELPPFNYPLFDLKNFKSITAMKQPTGLKFALEFINKKKQIDRFTEDSKK